LSTILRDLHGGRFSTLTRALDAVRCQDRCPANLTQKPLSPKKFIQDLKGEWEKTAAGIKNEDWLIDNVIQEETIWSCTACLSCQVNCPVSIPTFDKNIEMRRYLIMTLSKVKSELKPLEEPPDTFDRWNG
jgi:Fe-S oxidoreductase